MKKLYILFAGLIMIIASVLVVKQRVFKEMEIVKESVLSEQNTESLFECPIDELKIDELPDYAKNNETVKKIMIDNCYWAVADQSDPDHDGDNEIVLQTMGYGCGSCHAQDIFIIDGNDITFEYSGEDLSYSEIDSGFSIKEPIRKPKEEAYCCPSESTIAEYGYTNDSYNQTKKYVVKNQLSD